MSEKLSPERAVRLLRAKAGELEAQVLGDHEGHHQRYDRTTDLAADIALIAGLLADHIERMEYLVAHPVITTEMTDDRHRLDKLPWVRFDKASELMDSDADVSAYEATYRGAEALNLRAEHARGGGAGSPEKGDTEGE